MSTENKMKSKEEVADSTENTIKNKKELAENYASRIYTKFQGSFINPYWEIKLNDYLQGYSAAEEASKEREKILLEALQFYALESVWGNGTASIDPCDTYTCSLGVLRGGSTAIEAIANYNKLVKK